MTKPEEVLAKHPNNPEAAMREYAQIHCSETKQNLQNCVDVIEQLTKDLDLKSPLGMQVKLTLGKIQTT